MKKTTTTLMSMALVLGLASGAIAKSEKQNDPNKGEVVKAIKDAGGEHNPERMKLGKVGSIEAGETFYHAWCGTMKNDGYRVLIFNNTPSYLGFYTTEFEPVDYEDGAVLLDSGENDEDGNTSYFSLAIGSDGPNDKVRIDGIPSPFVKNEKAEAKKATGKAATTATTTADKENEIDYRDWKIKIKGQVSTFNAIFVKNEGGKVYIKDSKRGKTAAVPYSSLSAEDKDYVKKITK